MNVFATLVVTGIGAMFSMPVYADMSAANRKLHGGVEPSRHRRRWRIGPHRDLTLYRGYDHRRDHTYKIGTDFQDRVHQGM